jgi:hypothetical protein
MGEIVDFFNETTQAEFESFYVLLINDQPAIRNAVRSVLSEMVPVKSLAKQSTACMQSR